MKVEKIIHHSCGIHNVKWIKIVNNRKEEDVTESQQFFFCPG